MDFVVDRRIWLRITRDPVTKRFTPYNTDMPPSSKLLDINGFMCCLGHCELQLGVAKDAMLQVNMPGNIKLLPSSRPDTNIFVDGWGRTTSLASEAAAINDDPHYSDNQKEEKLINLFKRYGHTIRFEN